MHILKAKRWYSLLEVSLLQIMSHSIHILLLQNLPSTMLDRRRKSWMRFEDLYRSQDRQRNPRSDNCSLTLVHLVKKAQHGRIQNIELCENAMKWEYMYIELVKTTRFIGL